MIGGDSARQMELDLPLAEVRVSAETMQTMGFSPAEVDQARKPEGFREERKGIVYRCRD